MDEEVKNKRVVELLTEHGDNLLQSREVNHWIFFKSFDDMYDYKKRVMKEGFKIQNEHYNKTYSDSWLYTLQISREDFVDLVNINEITTGLSRLAEKFNGNYDGWETPVIEE